MSTFDEILAEAQSLPEGERIRLARALFGAGAERPLVVKEVDRRSGPDGSTVITFNVTNTADKAFTITTIEYETGSTHGRRQHFGTIRPLLSATIDMELENTDARVLLRGFETPNDLPKSVVIGYWTSNAG